MKILTKTVGLLGILAGLYGCGSHPCDSPIGKEYFIEVDLKNDCLQDVVYGSENGGVKENFKNPVDLFVKFQNKDGTYQDPKLLMHFEYTPDYIIFKDINGDGYPDMQYGMLTDGDDSGWGRHFDRYMILNDGRGSFDNQTPKLLKREIVNCGPGG